LVVKHRGVAFVGESVVNRSPARVLVGRILIHNR